MNYKEVLNDKTYYKIVNFFKEHPNSVETAEGISDWLEVNNVKKVNEALEKLSKLNILVKHESVGVNGYGLTQDKKINKKIDKYL